MTGRDENGVWTADTSLAALLDDGLFVDGDWVETKDQDPHGEVRLIQLADVGDGAFRDRSSRFLTMEKAKELRCTFLEPGDILIARMPDPLGRACTFPGLGQPAVTVVDVCIVRPNREHARPDWLVSAINSPQFRAGMADFIRGTTRQRISRKNLGTLKLHVPTMETQTAIASVLKRAQTRRGAASAHLASAGAAIERFRGAALAAASSGRLTEDWRDETRLTPADALLDDIRRARQNAPRAQDPELTPAPDDDELPATWAWVTFGSVLGELRNGVSPAPAMEPPGIPILRISAARPLQVDLTDRRFLRDEPSAWQAFGVRDGDLLFTRYNGSLALLGVCGMVRGVGTEFVLYPDKLMRARFDHQAILPEYVELFFSSPRARERMTSGSVSSAGQRGVSGATVKAQPFALPPLEEQREIVRRASAVLAVADRLGSQLEHTRTALDRLFSATLAKAFRGELVPSEAAETGGRGYGSTHGLAAGRGTSRCPAPRPAARRAPAARPAQDGAANELNS